MTAILAWIKGRIFSQGGLLIALLVGLILLFIIPNSDTILSKFGFETKTTLKGQLVSTQKDLKTTIDNNKTLESTGKIAEETHKSAVTAIVQTYEQEKKNDKKVEKINAKADKVIKPAIDQLKMTQVLTPTTVTFDKIKLNEVSRANIRALNETYSELFENDQG